MYSLAEISEYGLAHWLSFAFGVAIILFPIGRILGRLGYSPFWSVLALVHFSSDHALDRSF